MPKDSIPTNAEHLEAFICGRLEMTAEELTRQSSESKIIFANAVEECERKGISPIIMCAAIEWIGDEAKESLRSVFGSVFGDRKDQE